MGDHKVGVLCVYKDEKHERKSMKYQSRRDMELSLDEISQNKIIGFVFLKDIFEEMIQKEILDQDYHYDSTA